MHCLPTHAPSEQRLASATQRSVPESQHAVPPQTDPRQHRWPGPPQASHVPELPHTLLALLQRFPLQHTWPGPPHVAQVLPEQANVSTLHVRFGPQHGSPAPPHAMHVPPIGSHVAFGALHVVPQQGWLSAPHPPQLPPLQTPPPSTPVHTCEDETHRRMPLTVTQQPPLLHALAAQQGSVTSPHAWHVAPLHAAPVAHDWPSQQG
jgi:hypothetical protein